jgi:uncharacterized protein YkwD
VIEHAAGIIIPVALMKRRRLALALAALVLASCGAADSGGGGRVQRRTIVERTPTGTRTTVITTRTAPAPPPPPRPADPLPGDPLVKYNLDLLNHYRAKGGVGPLLYDSKISAFALAGSKELARDHEPHAHFRRSAEGAPGFGSRSAENQGDPNGVPPQAAEATASGKKQIAIMLQMMFDEGPGGGHHDNMMNPKLRRVGIGVYEPGGTLFLTNDFSD